MRTARWIGSMVISILMDVPDGVADTTVVSANIEYPTDAGLLAKAVRKIGRVVSQIKSCGAATRTVFRDRRRTAARFVRELSSKLHLRRAINGEQAQQTVLRLTKALAGLAAQTVIQAQAVLRNARRTAISSTGKVAGPRRRAVRQLAATIDRTHRIVG